MRYGDPLVEAVVSLMSEEDRGRTSAIWRKIEATDQIKEWNSIYFSFEFLAQTNLDGIDALLRDLDMLSIDAKQSLERRANSLFPNLLEKIWIDEEGDEVIDTQIVKLLNQSFDESCDTTLNINHLKLLSSENMGQFSNWEDRIYLMRDKAKAIFLSRLSLNKAKQNAYKQAMDENRLREAQLTIREHLLHESEAEHESQQMLHEMKINKFLFNGFDNPSINIESATAIYISSSDYPLEDK